MIPIEWDMHRHHKRIEKYSCGDNVYGVTRD